MTPFIEQLLRHFVVLFVVVEPITLVPIFGALTRGAEPLFRRRMAVKSVALAAIIFWVFALAGQRLLETLGVSVAAFKIAGGILLFLMAVDMVFARQSGLRSTTVREQDEARYREDISVFPLAFPLIAGPGALATLLLLLVEMGDSWPEFFGLMAMAMLVLAIALVLMLLTTPVMRVMGETGANVVSRLFGVVLVALAVQYVVDGALVLLG
ncbi:MAG: MarC family protein [Pseudomonadota bacterium]